MARTSTNFVVIGLGNFGSTIATELKRFGDYVMGVDLDETKVSHLAENLDQALIVDARDEEALREAGVGDCDVGIVAIGHNLEASVLATINLSLVGVDRVWAKANSKTHHRVLSRLGADRVIHPEVVVGRQTAQMLHNPLIRDYVSLGNTYNVVNLEVPESFQGESLEDLQLHRFDLRCLGVMRGSEFVGRDGDTCNLEENDRLLVLGRRNDLRQFTSSL